MKTPILFRMSVVAVGLSLQLSSTILHAQGSWSTASSTGFVARSNATTSVVDGKIYVMGGFGTGSIFLNSLEVFDPSSNSWSTPTTTGTFTPRYSLSSAVVDGKIYVLGGIAGSVSTPSTVNLIEVFDPQTRAWSTPTTTGTFTARAGFASAVINGKIYVIGGTNHGTYVSTVEVFDPVTNQWSTPLVTGTFTPRYYFTSNVVNNKIYAFGGIEAASVSNTLEVFDPLTNSWSTPAATGTSTARKGAASAALDGKMYVVGGSAGGIYLNTVEIFDPAANAWNTPSTSGNLTARFYPTAAAVAGRTYVIGGLGAGGAELNTNEMFTPEGSSVNDDAAAVKFECSPNPTNGTVIVRGGDHPVAHITIANMLGQPVMEFASPLSSEFYIDLSKLPNGAYFARFASVASVTTKILVKD